jgi:bifunctional non-homologous end joining protein LigD
VPRARAPKLPEYRPQLATLAEHAPSGDRWVHEIKLDGYRMGCVVSDGDISLISRKGRDWTASFPEVVTAAAGVRAKTAVIDGEVAVVLPDGRTSFQALQNASARRKGLTYFAFDLLYLDGRDLRELPLEARKERLRELVAGTSIRYSEHFAVDGRTMLEQACKLGAEGVVSKRRDRPHRPTRSEDWLKVKCVKRQEFVIGGYTEGEGSRQGLGAMLIGYHEGAALRFAGKVGTGKGFTAAFTTELRRKLERLEQRACPFTPRPPTAIAKRAHWVRPELVAEVQFGEWTDGGHVRHPSFLGFREDKLAAEVTREAPAPPIAVSLLAGRARPRRSAAKRSATVAGVAISSPDRVMYPALGFTKLDLAQLYADLAGWVLPHVAGRPLTLVRCEHGASANDALRSECKFLKHSTGWHRWVPASVRRVQIAEQKKVGEYLVIDSTEALLAIINGDILELHAWNSQADRVEQPDRLVFDLDPAPDVSWASLVQAAELVRTRLSAERLQSWVKSTGGKGLHVVVPLEPAAGWDECFAFAKTFAERLARESRRTFTTAFGKARRDGKVLIDYKRNHRTSVAVATFSTRARPDGTVSMPLRWDELDPRRPIEPCTVVDVRERVAAWPDDPWQDYWRCRQRLAAT